MKRRLSAVFVIVALLCGLLPGRFATAETLRAHQLSLPAAIQTLQTYGVIDVKPEADLRLNERVTRAEMAKVLGAALKLQDQATAGAAAPAFPDTGGHWANGWIAAARARGLFQGREDGRFYPQSEVTYAEVITALLRLVGRGPEAAVDWPVGAMVTAVQVGMIPLTMDLAGRWQEPATRADVFQLTAMAAGRVSLPNSGLTVFQQYHDRLPPGLDLSQFPSSVGQRTVTVTGRAKDAVTVTVNGTAAEVSPDGTFTARIDLQAGANEVPVVARDGAGNQAEVSVTIRVLPLSRLEFAQPVIETAVGQPFRPVVLRFNAEGKGAPADQVSFSYDPAALTRDESGALKALKAGEYSLRAIVEGQESTAKVVVAGDPAQVELKPDYATLVAGGAPVPVRIRVLDSEGRINPVGAIQLQVSTVPANAATLDRTSVTTKAGTAVVYVAPGMAPGGFGIVVKGSGAKPITSPLLPINVEQRRVAGIRLQTVPANVPVGSSQRVTVVATAVDQVGAPTPVREDTVVTLTSSNSAVLRLTKETAVIKAGAASSDFGGTDGAGISTGAAGAPEVTGRAGALPVTKAAVTAKRASALAELKVRLVQEVARADDLTAVLVEVTRLDEAGVAAASDTTPVVLLTQASGVSISQVSDAGGVVTFAVRSSTAGRLELTAGVPGRPTFNAPPVEVAFVQSQGSARSVLKLGATRATAGEAVPVFVSLEGATGGNAVNSGPPIRFQLQANNGATLSETEVAIPAGATRSEEVRLFVPSGVSNVSVSGTVIGGKPLTSVQVSVTPPPTPAPPPGGNNLYVLGPEPGRSPVAGDETRFVIQARLGGALRRGSYAFDLKVRLNGQELTQFPDNLKVTLGGYPVQNITGRTVNGEAEVWVSYTGAGTIELVPVPRAAHGLAYDHWGVQGVGEATTANAVTTGRITYVAGPLQRLDVSVDQGLGGSLEAVIKAARGRYATVRLKPVDAFGNPAGDSCVGRLSLVNSAPAGGLVIRTPWGDLPEHSAAVGVGGTATFTVAALTDLPANSQWAASMVCGSTPLSAQQSVKISTTLASSLPPVIESAGGDRSGEWQLRTADSYLRLRIAYDPLAPAIGELLVYDGATLLGRFGPIHPNDVGPDGRTVLIPKAKFGSAARSIQLRVQTNTGAMVTSTSSIRTVFMTP